MGDAKISLIRVPWNPEAEKLLSDAAGAHASYTVAEMRAEVEAGRSSLFFVVRNGNERLGYVVAWKEVVGTPELVVQAGEAFQNTLAHVPEVWPVIEDIAKREGCKSIRVHVPKGRPGRIRALRRVGMVEAETVLRKDF